MSVKVDIEVEKFVHIVLDEQTAKNLLALLWNYEDFNGRETTLYAQIVESTALDRADPDKVITKSGSIDFYKIVS